MKLFNLSKNRVLDLTEGTPWKVILRYSLPIMLSYFLQQLYVLTDAIICGQVLSGDEIAGVNDTFSLTFIFLQFAFGCTAGFSVITAKCVGAGDSDGMRKSFVSQIYLCIFISVVLTAVSIAILPWMLGLINVTDTNKAVYDSAYIYCLVIFAGIITQMGYNCLCGILRAYGDSVTPLVFLVVSTILNVVLDLLFLIPLKLGAMGAALATVITQFLSVVFCTIYIFAKYKDLRLKKEDLKISWKNVLEHVKQGVPLGLQFSVLAIGIIVMQGVAVQFDIMPNGVMVAGTPAQNGFGVAKKLFNFFLAFFNGLSSGVLGFTAQNYGKNDFGRIKKGTIQSIFIMLGLYLFILVSGMLLTINGAYQYIFLSADKISEQSVWYGNLLLYVDFSLYFIVGLLLVFRNAVQGICKSGFVLAAGCAELVARVLICAFVPRLINGGEINSTADPSAYIALCFGDVSAWIAGTIVLIIPTVKYILNRKTEPLPEQNEI